ncbi:SDR family oxidoreductase [Nakamurella silvestris]|nr:SDR family oxidoreductase [Nakamurella silvestris]
MDLHLSGRGALITASTGGIGWEIARTLAEEGAEVIVNGRSQGSVDAALAQIRDAVPGASVRGVVGDAGTAEGCEAIIAAVGEVDILVNNLGIYEVSAFVDTTDEEWLRLFEVNILSGVRLSRHFVSGMLTRDSGRIVFISSEAALTPAQEMPHYSATKTMELSISRNLAELTSGSKVTVNVVLPGSTRTDGVRTFVQDLFPDLPYEEAEATFMRDNRPTSIIGRLIDPTEIADMVAFVCSPRSSAMNGSAVRVDGGIVRSVF